MSDTNRYGGISPRLEDALKNCPDYVANPGECKIYGNCRWAKVGLESLAITWIECCIRLQEYKNGKPLKLETA